MQLKIVYCSISYPQRESTLRSHTLQSIMLPQDRLLLSTSLQLEAMWPVVSHCSKHVKTRQTLQRISTGVDIFFSLIFSYFCFFVAALNQQTNKQQVFTVQTTTSSNYFTSYRHVHVTNYFKVFTVQTLQAPTSRLTDTRMLLTTSVVMLCTVLAYHSTAQWVHLHAGTFAEAVQQFCLVCWQCEQAIPGVTSD